MALAPRSRGRTGFNFRCNECGTEWLNVSLARLDQNPTLECYQCGTFSTVPNAQRLVMTARQAEAALKALHEVMDECTMFSAIELVGISPTR